ncbi:hypothetical protein L1049_000493 [Liquidambar formosana]|uniref:Srp40 C-terminal domain-containing protein n=1 Tax=Liquidambar formosana TaxID=63359 RepID=A0AAP0NAN9_LIQFO
MLQTQAKNTDLTTLLALKPRQVMLANPNMKHHIDKPCSERASTDKQAFTLKPDPKTLLLHSVLQFLQRNGFSKTLKRFRSEAKLDENDSYKRCSLDLEEIYYKCLETCSHASTNSDSFKLQDSQTDGITKKGGDSNCVASVETVTEKKKKRSDQSDSNAVVNNQPEPADKFNNVKNSEERLTNDLVTESNMKFKKKKSKKSSDTISEGADPVGSVVLEMPADDIASEPQLDESNKKCKSKKKKKNKLVSETLVDNVEHHQLEAPPGISEDKSKDLVSFEGKSTTDYDVNNKTKDKKKKKDKATSDSLVDNVLQCSAGDKQGEITTKFKDLECLRDSQVVNSALVNTCDILLEEKNVKSKGKKKKKDGMASESFPGGDSKELDQEKLRIDYEKDNFQTLEEHASSKENKGSKKRKRFSSEEKDSQSIEKVAIEECKRRKTEGLEESKTIDQLKKVNVSLGSDGHAGNEGKEVNGKVGFNDTQKISIKQLDKANGNLERNGEKSAVPKTLKEQRNGSVERKTVNAFQRVKVDEVEFVDEKLQDNSYWAKDGAEIGYGAKAQEVLGQVRGRDFRHEKTKKKRGSYRGGQIDLQSHSVKFNYSDDD